MVSRRAHEVLERAARVRSFVDVVSPRPLPPTRSVPTRVLLEDDPVQRATVEGAPAPLGHEIPNAEMKHGLDATSRSARRQAELIEELLDLARVTKGQELNVALIDMAGSIAASSAGKAKGRRSR